MFDKPTKNAEGKDKRRTGHCQDQYLLACWNDMVEFSILKILTHLEFGDQKMLFWKTSSDNMAIWVLLILNFRLRT